MENHHAINGKTHYSYGHFQYLIVCLPEDNRMMIIVSRIHHVTGPGNSGDAIGSLFASWH